MLAHDVAHDARLQGLEGLLHDSSASNQRVRAPSPNVIQRSSSIAGGNGTRASSAGLGWRGSDAGSELDFAVSARA
jgi:hypothetical protein